MTNRHLKTEPPFQSRAGGAMGTYGRALRANRLLVVVAVLGAILGYLAAESARVPRYEATAQLLVSPVPAHDRSFLGLPVLRQTPGDPTRTIETAAALLRSTGAANRTARSLKPPTTARRILAAVSLEPQGQSNIVAVSATAETPLRAAQIANAYARATLVERSAALRQSAAAQIPRVQARLAAIGGASAPGAAELAERLTALRELAEGGDPSLSLSQAARIPDEEAGPSRLIVLLIVVLGAFAIASLVAVVRELMTRAVRDENEAVALYPLPVLARLPVLNSGQARAMTVRGWSPPPATREAFRTLLAQLEHERGRVILLTSASAGDGKTTSAINLAAAVAETGDSVILLDFDLRKPEIGRILGLPNGVPLTALAHPRFRLADALTPALGLATVSVLATTVEEDSRLFVEAAKRRLPDLIEEARSSADWVVIDTAPLGQVSDALGILQAIDDLIIVTRPGVTDRRNLETTRELLERTYERAPTGLLVISKQRPSSNASYDYRYEPVVADPA
ncbi:MAG: P-loop NTPase [Chloroflexota bacterium]|nr:P-loop NTPase [Chloroflexota bacterium]